MKILVTIPFTETQKAQKERIKVVAVGEAVLFGKCS